MNTAFKHLDAKLRLAELTIGQWLGVLLGASIGLIWGIYLSPLGRDLTIVTSIYVGAMPAGAALAASLTEFDAGLLLRSVIAWRRLEGRFVPGGGEQARGYVLRDDPIDARVQIARLDTENVELESLWEEVPR